MVGGDPVLPDPRGGDCRVRAAGTWTSALLYGALFGLCVYAAYDLTNLATLRGWSMALSAVDLLWGAVVTAASTLAAFLVVRVVQTP